MRREQARWRIFRLDSGSVLSPAAPCGVCSSAAQRGRQRCREVMLAECMATRAEVLEQSRSNDTEEVETSKAGRPGEGQPWFLPAGRRAQTRTRPEHADFDESFTGAWSGAGWAQSVGWQAAVANRVAGMQRQQTPRDKQQWSWALSWKGCQEGPMAAARHCSHRLVTKTLYWSARGQSGQPTRAASGLRETLPGARRPPPPPPRPPLPGRERSGAAGAPFEWPTPTASPPGVAPAGDGPPAGALAARHACPPPQRPLPPAAAQRGRAPSPTCWCRCCCSRCRRRRLRRRRRRCSQCCCWTAPQARSPTPAEALGATAGRPPLQEGCGNAYMECMGRQAGCLASRQAGKRGLSHAWDGSQAAARRSGGPLTSACCLRRSRSRRRCSALHAA